MAAKTAFERFDDTLNTLLKVPHRELTAKLDAEKKAKAEKKKQKELVTR
jgi:hypothetical protein